jgi:hypothetical protein
MHEIFPAKVELSLLVIIAEIAEFEVLVREERHSKSFAAAAHALAKISFHII